MQNHRKNELQEVSNPPDLLSIDPSAVGLPEKREFKWLLCDTMTSLTPGFHVAVTGTRENLKCTFIAESEMKGVLHQDYLIDILYCIGKRHKFS